MNDKHYLWGEAPAREAAALAESMTTLNAARQISSAMGTLDSSTVAKQMATAMGTLDTAAAAKQMATAMGILDSSTVAKQMATAMGTLDTAAAAKQMSDALGLSDFASGPASTNSALAFRKKIDALDPSRGIRSAMEQAAYLDTHLGGKLTAEATSYMSANFLGIGSSLAKPKAIEEMLLPSKIGAKYHEEQTRNWALKVSNQISAGLTDPYKDLASALDRIKAPLGEDWALKLSKELAAGLTSPYKDFASAFDAFKEPLGRAVAKDLVATVAEANRHWNQGRSQEKDALDSTGKEGQADVAHLVHQVAENVSKAQTPQELMEQVILAIREIKDPFHQKLIFLILYPFFLALVFSVVNPVADFQVKKRLESSSQQKAKKQLKVDAREAIGDVQLLSDYRFVSTQQLVLKSSAKARGIALGSLRLGQVVRVLEREKDFTLVIWRSEDGKAELQGWVYSRYLRRFD